MNTHCAGLVCAKFYWRAAVFRKHANIFPHLWDYIILFFNSFLSFDPFFQSDQLSKSASPASWPKFWFGCAGPELEDPVMGCPIFFRDLAANPRGVGHSCTRHSELQTELGISVGSYSHQITAVFLIESLSQVCFLPSK